MGVNAHLDTIEEPLEILRVSHEVERAQVAALGERRHERSIAHVHAALGALDMAARGDDNLVEPMLEAARHEATLGEICGVLREVFGGYTEPARI